MPRLPFALGLIALVTASSAPAEIARIKQSSGSAIVQRNTQQLKPVPGLQLLAGDRTRAEADFRDAIARNPQNGEALFQLANLLYQGKDAFRARAFLQRFDALGKPTAASLKLGHDIESSMGNPEGARNYGKRLRSQFPDSEQAHALDSTENP